MTHYAFPLMLLFGAGLILLEHVRPAHPMQPRASWYARAILLNLAQLGVFYVVDRAWAPYAGIYSLDLVGESLPPLAGALAGYVIFTFAIYWWHRARHASPLLWRVFHQLHHSPTRIQTLTAYYIHPLDMVVALSISNVIVFVLLGLNFEGAAWYTLITGCAGFFIHSNIQVPRAVGYVFQTPEMHRLHHKSGHHAHNYSDIVIWDWLFGTYCNPHEPIAACGFDEATESRMAEMLLGHDLTQTRAQQAHGSTHHA